MFNTSEVNVERISPVAKFDFEKAMERLEQIIADLESGRLGLDESIKCHKKLTEAETKVKQLIKTEDGEFGLQLFDDEETSDESA